MLLQAHGHYLQPPNDTPTRALCKTVALKVLGIVQVIASLKLHPKIVATAERILSAAAAAARGCRRCRRCLAAGLRLQQAC